MAYFFSYQNVKRTSIVLFVDLINLYEDLTFP